MLEFGLGLTSLLTPVLYGVAILTIILTITWRIEIGIYFLAFFFPLQNILDYLNDFPFGEDLNDLMLAAMLIKWLISKRDPDEPMLTQSALYLPIILLLIWTFMELFRGSLYLGFGMPLSPGNLLLVAWKNYWMPALFCVIIMNNMKSPRQLMYLLFVTMLAMLMLDRNFYTVLSQNTVEHYSDELKDKFVGGGIALGGNSLAVFLAQNAIVFVALFLEDSNKTRRLLFFFTAALSYYCLMFLFSRGGYLGAVASVFFLGVIRERKLLLLLGLLIIFYQALLPQPVIERIQMTRTETGFDTTAQERLGMWEQAKAMISESPILGWGFSITPFIEVRAGYKFGNRTWGSFHNAFIQTTVELGAVGLALLLWIYFYGMALGWRLYKLSTDPFARAFGLGFCASVIGMLAGNVNGSYWHFYTAASFFWIYLAMTIRWTILARAALEQQPAIENAEAGMAFRDEIRQLA